jgi:hypothetical protein
MKRITESLWTLDDQLTHFEVKTADYRPAAGADQVVVVSDEHSKTYGHDEFAGLILKAMESSAEKTASVFGEAIYGLLRTRDFLGIQLDHAWGNISDAEFEERAAPYLAVTPPDHLALARKTCVLATEGRLRPLLDEDTISVMFQCTPADAARAIALIPTLRGSLLPKNG